ncbi:MAG TPA: hypothetical protein VG248_05995 [Caulobacteraceae bacterium]|nr:hypothetical protein [Caulobacteraceae bacterium]
MSSRAPRDILGDWRLAFLAYCLPTAAIIASGSLAISGSWRAAIWAVALLVMGGACLANALRCGRVHCFFTGPFFVAMAIAVVLYGAGVLPLGARGWNALGLVMLIGAFVLTTLPELIAGKYRPVKGRRAQVGGTNRGHERHL